MKVDLTVEISGIKMKNPSMLAAGILGVSASTLVRVAEAGAGSVVTKNVLPNKVVVGNPAKIIKDVKELKYKTGEKAYD